MTARKRRLAASAAFLTLAASGLASVALGQTPDAARIEPQYAASYAAYMAMKAQAKPAQLPDWSGVWRRQWPSRPVLSFDSEGGPSPISPEYANSSAKLTPKYAKAYADKLASVAKGIEWDRLSYCLPAGMPRFLTEPWLREFIVTPQVTFMTHEQMSEVRRIYTDGKKHLDPGAAAPLWEGDSIGFWDGDTLVVHTAHLKAGEYQRAQPDYSFKVSMVERVRKIDPTHIEDDITVYDPDSLLEPYKAKFLYVKVDNPDRINFGSCEEGNNVFRLPDGSTSFRLPGEPGYHDPRTFGIPDVALDSLP